MVSDEELDELFPVPKNLISYCETLPNILSKKTAFKILKKLYEIGFPPLKAVPSADEEGGIVFCWPSEKTYISISCYNDGEIWFYNRIDEDLYLVEPVELDTELKKIHQFFQKYEEGKNAENIE